MCLGSSSFCARAEAGGQFRGMAALRLDPRRMARGDPPLHLDYGPPKGQMAEYMRNESRLRVVERTDPVRFKEFLKESQEAAQQRYAVKQQLAGITVRQIDLTTDDHDRPAAENED